MILTCREIWKTGKRLGNHRQVKEAEIFLTLFLFFKLKRVILISRNLSERNSINLCVPKAVL